MVTPVRLLHRCEDHLPYPQGHGDIYECECGKWWKVYNPGNPEYNGWKRAWFRQMFSRLRWRKEPSHNEPIGEITSIEEDDTGLIVKMTFNDEFDDGSEGFPTHSGWRR